MYLNMYSSDQAGQTTTYIVGTYLEEVKYHELHVSRWTVVPGCPVRVPRRQTLVRYGDPSECGQNPALQPDSTSHLGPGCPRPLLRSPNQHLRARVDGALEYGQHRHPPAPDR